MNDSLILFLEEKGFVCKNSIYFIKKTYHHIAKEIEIIVHVLYWNDGQVYFVDIDVLTTSENQYVKPITQIRISKLDDLELKVKKIINAIDDIVTTTLVFDVFPIFKDDIYNFPNEMTFSSYSGTVIDLSGDEIVIANKSNAINEG